MATSTTTTVKAPRTFKGGSSPITQRVETQPASSALPFSIVTPLQIPNTVGETFKTTSNVADGIVDDFKNMLLTNFGERLGRPDFGANLNSLLTERLSLEDWNARATSLIKNTTQKYMPYITVGTITINEMVPDNDGFSKVKISLLYSIFALGIQNRRIDLTLTNLS